MIDVSSSDVDRVVSLFGDEFYLETATVRQAIADRWFAFRDERLRKTMVQWLADHDTESTRARPEGRTGDR